MDSVLRRDTFASWRDFAHSWRPRPNTGSLLKDLVFVLLVVFIQSTVFPTLLESAGIFDFLTPWIVITAIRQRAFQATLLAMVGAFALETKLAVPAGIYLCSYWIMINTIFQIRLALSWRYRTPWLVSYAAASLWIMLFEVAVLIFIQDNWSFSFGFLFQQIVKILVAVGFGMYLSQEWMRIDAEEPVPE